MTLIIYHGGCVDGFGAAYAAQSHFGALATYHPAVYNEPPPDCDGHDVYLLDFSYKLPVLLEMAGRARHITVIDHHQSAYDELIVRPQGLEEPHRALPDNVVIVIDQSQSGAVLAWKWFCDDKVPRFYEYIQDHDIFTRALPGTDEFSLALRSYRKTWEVWERLIKRGPAALIQEGTHIKRWFDQQVSDLRGKAFRALIGGHSVPVANASYCFASYLGHALCEGEPFAAIYYQTDRRVNFSLRSDHDGLDVAKVAELYGGGGHRHAAGFSLPCQPMRLLTEQKATWEP